MDDSPCGDLAGHCAAAAARRPLASPPPDWAPLLEKHFGGTAGRGGSRYGERTQFYAYRGNERFLMCSVFKLLAAAAILSRADAGQENPRSHNRVWADRSAGRIAGDDRPCCRRSHELDELCAAAVSYSDNTAGNLLLAQLGGPPGVTQYARSLGDTRHAS